jgi:acyl carrier protein
MDAVSNMPQYESDTIEMIGELTADWDTGLASLTRETAIVKDLGFESLDVVYLVTAIEQRYGRRDLPFDQLLMTEGRYVDDLTIGQIAAFLQRHLGA